MYLEAHPRAHVHANNVPLDASVVDSVGQVWDKRGTGVGKVVFVKQDEGFVW